MIRLSFWFAVMDLLFWLEDIREERLQDITDEDAAQFPNMPPRLIRGALVGTCEPLPLTPSQMLDLCERLPWCMWSCTPGHPSTSEAACGVEVIAFPDAVTIVGYGRDLTHLEAVQLCERLIAQARLG